MFFGVLYFDQVMGKVQLDCHSSSSSGGGGRLAIVVIKFQNVFFFFTHCCVPCVWLNRLMLISKQFNFIV